MKALQVTLGTLKPCLHTSRMENFCSNGVKVILTNGHLFRGGVMSNYFYGIISPASRTKNKKTDILNISKCNGAT